MALCSGAAHMEEWNTIFTGEKESNFTSVQQTQDSGFIASGWNDSSIDGTRRGLLIKTDDKGNELWNINLRKSFLSSVINSGQQTSDGGYVLAGATGTYGISGYDAWLIKVSGKPTDRAKNQSVDSIDLTKIPAEKTAGFEIVLATVVIFAVRISKEWRRMK